jgi:hypothetical protein
VLKNVNFIEDFIMELDAATTKVTDTMQDFYQLVSSKSHEFDQLETDMS